MSHNFILLKSGVDIAAFAYTALVETDSDYEVSSELLDDVAAHNKMIGGEKRPP